MQQQFVSGKREIHSPKTIKKQTQKLMNGWRPDRHYLSTGLTSLPVRASLRHSYMSVINYAEIQGMVDAGFPDKSGSTKVPFAPK
jgi:hypothetical protein